MKLGVALRTGTAAQGKPLWPYTYIREMAQRVEAAGFDSIWLYDHLLYRWPGRKTDGIWECWTVLAALAEATQRVELGTIVLAVPFRNPALVAKMAVTLDEVSGCRLTLGLGAGWHQPEFDAFGVPFDHRASRFAEAVDIIRPLLRDGRVDYSGRYYRADSCELVRRGPRPGGPPLLLAGKGPRMLDVIARSADLRNTAWHTSAVTIVEPIAALRAACARVGRDPATLAITANVAVVYADLGQPTMPGAYLSGSSEEIAATLEGLRAAGIAQVIVDVAPFEPAAIDRFADAVRQFQAAVPV
jgi:probable F420-dependent oxidoreductase